MPSGLKSIKKEDHMRRLFRLEEERSERLLNSVRLALSIVFFAISFIIKKEVPEHSIKTIWVGASLYLCFSIYMRWYLRLGKALGFHKYLSTFVDIAILTGVLISFGTFRTFKTEAFLIYFVWIAVAVIRFSVPLTLFTGILSVSSYVLIASYALLRGTIETGSITDSFISPKVSLTNIAIKIIFILAFFIIMALVARGYRNLVGKVTQSERRHRLLAEELTRHMTEKEHILMDLHDGIGGIVTNISLLSELGADKSSEPEVKKTLKTISELSRESLSEIRGFMHSLNVKDLTWDSLFAELRRFGSTMTESHGISFEIAVSAGDAGSQPGSLLCLNTFKIYKEAISNIVKHSKAKNVSVFLWAASGRLVLSIRDDGIGFDSAGGRGRGLSNMKKRAGEIGGSFNISSDKKGSLVELEVPIPLKYPEGAMDV